MIKHVKLLLTVLVATSLLGIGASSASATNLSINEQRFRIVWSSLEFSAAGATVRCPITLEGSFHSRTLPKTTNILLGYVTRATLTAGSCASGTARALTETLPWHIKYSSFNGTLPNITGVNLRVIGASFLVLPTGLVSCLARTTEASPARFTANVSSGTVTGLAAESRAGIPLTGGLCEFAGEAHLSGTGTVTVLGGTGQLRITLIEGPQRASLSSGIPSENTILMTIRNEMFPEEGEEITINEIKLGPPNEALYEYNDWVPCVTKKLAPQRFCFFNVLRSPGGGITKVEVGTTVGKLQRNVS